MIHTSTPMADRRIANNTGARAPYARTVSDLTPQQLRYAAARRAARESWGTIALALRCGEARLIAQMCETYGDDVSIAYFCAAARLATYCPPSPKAARPDVTRPAIPREVPETSAVRQPGFAARCRDLRARHGMSVLGISRLMGLTMLIERELVCDALSLDRAFARA